MKCQNCGKEIEENDVFYHSSFEILCEKCGEQKLVFNDSIRMFVYNDENKLFFLDDELSDLTMFGKYYV